MHVSVVCYHSTNMSLPELLGDVVIRSDGREVSTHQLTSDGGVIGLYFSAYWCGPCGRFTPILASVYNEIQNAGNRFEIIFVSFDHVEDSFDEYFGLEMPWLAIPFSEKSNRDACTEHYKVAGIPTLVLVDAMSGEVILKDGAEVIEAYGAHGFPFTKDRLQECERKKLEFTTKIFSENFPLTEFMPLTTIANEAIEIDIQSLIARSEILVFAFLKGETCFGSTTVLPKLIDAQLLLGADKLSIIMVPMECLTNFDESAQDLMKDTPLVKFGEKSKNLLSKFELVFPEMNSPHIVVMSTRSENGIQVIAENAGKCIYMYGAKAFPWTTEAAHAMESKDAAFEEEIRSKQKDLEFLTPSDQCLIVDKNGGEVILAKLQSSTVIGLYFSAHWCGPCRSFTPKLIEVYSQCKEQGKHFEVVFVSSDETATDFEQYYSKMPWCALSFDNKNLKNILSQHFDVDGIPQLILLNGKGELISANGTSAIRSYGVDGFPFTTERLEECEKEKEKQYTELLIEMGSFSFLERLTTIGEREKELEVETITSSYETLGFTFINDEDSSDVLQKLADVQKSLSKEKFGIVIIPLSDLKRFDDEAKMNLNNFPMVAYGKESDDVLAKFEKIVPGIESTRVIVAATNDKSIFKILCEDAGEEICQHGAQAFPWTTEAIDAKVAEDESFREEMKLKQTNLEFFAPNSKCHIVDRAENEVALQTLQSHQVVGIYFSAHWCDSCRSFTSELKKMYEMCKQQGKSFEIIFVSYSEENEQKFEEYYGEMPWCALSYKDRSLAECLGDLFNVYGIPTLVLLQGDGELITEDGISALQYGIDYYPWKEVDIERAESDSMEREKAKHQAALKEEEEIYQKQSQAQRIVLRRRIGGLLDVRISVDHIVEFSSFCTVAAPTAIMRNGAKAWYEVTFINGCDDAEEGTCSQIGWATDQLQINDEYSTEGVGDDEHGYGFDGQRMRTYRERIGNAWGMKIEPNSNHVLGVAIDLEKGELLYGLNGDWNPPMGVAFEHVDTNDCYFPALTGQNVTLSVNFGSSEMIFGPPDDSFLRVVDIVAGSM